VEIAYDQHADAAAFSAFVNWPADLVLLDRGELIQFLLVYLLWQQGNALRSLTQLVTARRAAV